MPDTVRVLSYFLPTTRANNSGHPHHSVRFSAVACTTNKRPCDSPTGSFQNAHTYRSYERAID